MNRRGFTLVEVLFSLFVFVLLSGVIFTFVTNGYRQFYAAQDDAQQQDALRTALRKATASLREAREPSWGSPSNAPIESATASALTFYADADNDDDIERIRLFVSNGMLQRGVIDPSGTTYPSGNEVVTTLVDNVVGTSPFLYYDASYNGVTVTTPLTLPVTPANIRAVRVTITADTDPARPTNKRFTAETLVVLRNLNLP